MPKPKPKPQAKPAAPQPPPATAEQAAEQKFTRDLLIRGDAAERDDAGNLPLSATHEIVNDPASDTPKVVRRRFKLT
ncbi:MAG TPA: hypothetical protein VFF00_02270 [Candidatus Elarobacter sp.]|nr:hypothetical protein [Dongiaceae bacterium]HZW52827.1 hypothetical protein [Candidatus Elarobacter sp.]